MPPIDHPLNLTTQAILTYGSWGLTVVILALAIRMGMRERTPLYVLMVLAVMVGAFVEPLYDVAMMLYFYSTTGMWTHFTSFHIPQPIWTHSGYVVLYASAAIYVARQIWRGRATRRLLFVFAGVELAMSSAFEIFAINGGAYGYWGPHVLRIFNYPLVIGVLEATQVICFAVLTSQLRTRATATWQLLGVFVLFPVTFLGANFGAGGPMIISLHADGTSTTLILTGTLVSIAFAAVLVSASASLLAQGSAGDTQHLAGGDGEQHPELVLRQPDAVEQR
jgi:hypothetical protein